MRSGSAIYIKPTNFVIGTVSKLIYQGKYSDYKLLACLNLVVFFVLFCGMADNLTTGAKQLSYSIVGTAKVWLWPMKKHHPQSILTFP